MSDGPTPRLLREWENRVRAEYASAAAFAQITHLAVVCGIPPELVRVGTRIVNDELDHASLSHDALVALGGGGEPTALDVGALEWPRSPDGPLATLLDAVLYHSCMGETLAVPLFHAMRKPADHPAVRPVLTRILQDEPVHSRFGWDVLDAILAMDEAGARARATARLPALIEQFRQAYGVVVPRPGPTPFERRASLMAMEEYAAIFEATLVGTILPRFAERGIALEA